MSDAMRAELAAIPGVARVRPIRISDIDFRGMPIKLMSTDIAQYVQRAKFMVLDGSSDSLASALMEGSVAVSENLARHFDIRPGQQIALSTKDGTRSFTVAAVVVDYTNDKGTIIMDRGTFIRHWSDDRTDTYELYAQSEASVESVRQAINARMGEQNDLFVLTNREFRKAFAAVSENVFALLRVLELVTLFVAGLGLMTAVFANVLDRVREIGVLRAIGMLRAEVRNMVVLESTLVGSVGTVTGLLIGTGIGYIMLRHVTTVQLGWYLPYRVPVSTIVALILGTIPVAALAGLFPSRQAAALQVVDALDYE
jgi:putative ABC transport system permease protein